MELLNEDYLLLEDMKSLETINEEIAEYLIEKYDLEALNELFIKKGKVLGFAKDDKGNYVDEDGEPIDDAGFIIDGENKERRKTPIVPEKHELPAPYNDPSKYKLNKHNMVVDKRTGRIVVDSSGKGVKSQYTPQSGGEEYKTTKGRKIQLDPIRGRRIDNLTNIVNDRGENADIAGEALTNINNDEEQFMKDPTLRDVGTKKLSASQTAERYLTNKSLAKKRKAFEKELKAKRKKLVGEYKTAHGLDYTGFFGKRRLKKAANAYIANLTLGRTPSNEAETNYKKALADYDDTVSKMDSKSDIKAINAQYGKDMKQLKNKRTSRYNEYIEKLNARKKK